MVSKYGSALYYYNKGVEVDFYVPDEELAIQVSYNLNDAATLEREKGALLKLAQRYELRKLMIITYSQATEINEGDRIIEVVPVWKWLLA